METIAPLVDNPVATSSGPLFNFDDQGIRQAQNFLRSVRRSGRPIVGAHPGSGSWKKCWPAERFETLIHALKDDLGCEVLLMLGPADEHLATRFKPLAAKLGCVIAENLPLRSLAAVLSLCDAYIGNDSGVTHLAALTGIPTLAIFGPTDPVVWAPSGLKVRVVAGVAHCAPCNREIMTRCERQICLEAISVQQMTHLIGDILAVVLGDNAPQDSR
jgi:ADP-heptose:LPS heptosyltransferase